MLKKLCLALALLDAHGDQEGLRGGVLAGGDEGGGLGELLALGPLGHALGHFGGAGALPAEGEQRQAELLDLRVVGRDFFEDFDVSEGFLRLVHGDQQLHQVLAGLRPPRAHLGQAVQEVARLPRLPDGADTNDAATDWAFTTTKTPGAANVASS